jgi:hypothetical protein
MKAYDSTKGGQSELIVILGAGLAALNGLGSFPEDDRGKSICEFII